MKGNNMIPQFQDIVVGDRVWSLIYRRWYKVVEIVNIGDKPIYLECLDEDFHSRTNIDIYGRFEEDECPTFFWDVIEFRLPKPPKRKVKKTVKRWVNARLEKDGNVTFGYESEAEALKTGRFISRGYPPTGNKIIQKEVTFEIEVYE